MNQALKITDRGPDVALTSPGSNQSGMRAYNERLVLSLIRQSGAMAKAEIARRTGLSAQTVSVIMRSLEADGLLEKDEPVRAALDAASCFPMFLSGGANAASWAELVFGNQTKPRRFQRHHRTGPLSRRGGPSDRTFLRKVRRTTDRRAEEKLRQNGQGDPISARPLKDGSR